MKSSFASYIPYIYHINRHGQKENVRHPIRKQGTQLTNGSQVSHGHPYYNTMIHGNHESARFARSAGFDSQWSPDQREKFSIGDVTQLKVGVFMLEEQVYWVHLAAGISAV